MNLVFMFTECDTGRSASFFPVFRWGRWEIPTLDQDKQPMLATAGGGHHLPLAWVTCVMCVSSLPCVGLTPRWVTRLIALLEEI